MPSKRSARVQERKRVMNAPLRSKAKTIVSKARRLIEANELEAAEQAKQAHKASTTEGERQFDALLRVNPGDHFREASLP